MNFSFEVGDIVEFRMDSPRRKNGVEMKLVRKFVSDVFHAELPDGSLLRVRTNELLRIRRPSDAVKHRQVQMRKLEKKRQRDLRTAMIERRRTEFAHVKEFGIRLTAEGLPDQRMKPRYSAKNAPIVIKSRKRSGLL